LAPAPSARIRCMLLAQAWHQRERGPASSAASPKAALATPQASQALACTRAAVGWLRRRHEDIRAPGSNWAILGHIVSCWCRQPL
jgi:hypothetical protein